MAAKPNYKELELKVKELEDRIAECEKELEKLTDIKEHYEALFNQSLDSIFVFDLNGNFLDVNPASYTSLGYTKEELLAINATDLVCKEHLARMLNNTRDIIKTGSQKIIGEYKLKKKDGTFNWVESNAAAILHNGKIYAVQGISRDISQRKIMEEDIRQKWDALKKASIGMYIMQDRQFVWFNQRFINDTKYNRQFNRTLQQKIYLSAGSGYC